MQIDMPELAEIKKLERIMETTEDKKKYIQAKQEREWIFEKLRREVLENEY